MSESRPMARSDKGKSLRDQAEALIHARRGGTSIKHIDELIHELEVHRAELEIQNEELRRAEQDLVEARDRYSDLYNFAPIGYVALDPEGTISEANLAVAALLGVERTKLVGARLTSFVEPDDQDGFYFHRQIVLSTGRKQTCELTMHRADGTPLIVRLDSLASVDAAGELHWWQAALIDMTEQRRLEREVLDIAELEQRRFGQELHDDLGQRLIGAKMFVHTLAARLAAHSAPESELAQRVVSLLDDTVQTLRKFARGLVPLDLNGDNLIPALQGLAHHIGELDDVKCDFQSPSQLGRVDDLAATYLFRIAQEATTNAIRHGRAHHVRLGLFRDNASIILKIQDDGVGFEMPAEGTGGVGLRSMRYRADVIGARLTFEPASNGGTVVACRLPVPSDPSPPAI